MTDDQIREAIDKVYRRWLLDLAVGEGGRHTFLTLGREGWIMRRGLMPSHSAPTRTYSTLTDALLALLADLGVDVPERPSVEAVRSALTEWVDSGEFSYADPILAEAVLACARLEVVS